MNTLIQLNPIFPYTSEEPNTLNLSTSKDPIVQLNTLIQTSGVYDPHYEKIGLPLLEKILMDADLSKRALKEIIGFSKFQSDNTHFILYALNRCIHG